MRDVTFIQLHSPLFIPNAGQLTGTLEVSKFKGMKMRTSAAGVEVWHKGLQFLVPYGAINGILYAVTEAHQDIQPAPQAQASPGVEIQTLSKGTTKAK